ncbi:uncharacterized protein LOC116266649 [Nymphaea colorata]|uniref:uncharacterized protein LOC116266649 n=1 Tax=Nymphaea colorata TaxID=210225 RepID=UPI00129E6914|nr:uncharacterized protein LOC116266649 [Nymphaea colorata]
MTQSTAATIQRMSSIDREPRTLHVHQMRRAREEALRVIQTKSSEEAVRIFTEGLLPVGPIAENEKKKKKNKKKDRHMRIYELGTITDSV